MSLNDNPFTGLINFHVGKTLPSTPYKFPKRTSTIFLEEEDLDTFNSLYGVTGGNQCVGNGEVALQWLFGDQLKYSSSTDLEYNGKSIDVKSYPKNSFITLGKWKENQQIRKVINSMFSCYNLINIGKGNSFNSELGFSTSHIVESMKSTLDLTDMLREKDGSFSHSIFKDIWNTTEEIKKEFKSLSESRGREFIKSSSKTRNQIISESISDIIYSVVTHKLFSSNSGIGNFGYLINVSKKNPKEITGEIEIYKIRGVSKDTQILQDNFSVVSGEIKIKPQILDMVK